MRGRGGPLDRALFRSWTVLLDLKFGPTIGLRVRSTAGTGLSGRRSDRRIAPPLRCPVTDGFAGGVSDCTGKAAGFDTAGDLLKYIQNGGCEPSLLELIALTIDVDGEPFFGFWHGSRLSPGMRLAERAVGVHGEAGSLPKSSGLGGVPSDLRGDNESMPDAFKVLDQHERGHCEDLIYWHLIRDFNTLGHY
jgi:hypothetical protein